MYHFIGDPNTDSSAAIPDPTPPDLGMFYDVHQDMWDRAWVGCKDAQPSWDGVRDYTALLTPEFQLMRVPPANAYAWPSLTPMTDPARGEEIFTYQEDHLDGMILPDLRVLTYQPLRRHPWYIAQENEFTSEETPVPAILQAAAMIANDPETY